MSQTRSWRWAMAMVPPLVALGVQLAIGSRLQAPVWFLFYPAVFLSSWIGGLRPGIFATVLSAAAVLSVLVSPLQPSGIPLGQYLAATVFLATGIMFGVFHEHLRTASRRTKRASEAVASLLEQAPDGIFVADLDGRYTDVNTAGCRMLDHTRDEIVGKTILDLIPPEQAGRLESEKRQLLEGGDVVSEWTLRRKDGTCLPVEVSAKILPDGRWQGFVRDISVRKHLEQALQSSYEDLSRAQAVAKVGSWRLNLLSGDLLWSDETFRILGVPPGAPMTYETFLTTVHPEDRAYVDQKWSAALGGDPYDIEHRVIANGKVKWAREIADLSFDEHDRLVGGLGITHDITDQKRYEEELRLAEAKARGAVQTRDDVLGIVAHDLRNPLNSILMQAEMLGRGGGEHDRGAQKRVEAIRRAVARMNRLIEDLLDVTRMEAGPFPLQGGPASALQLVCDSVESQEALAASASLELRLGVSGELPEIWGDRRRVIQILDNLIGNAIKFTRAGGSITVGAVAQGGEVVFSVTDTGTGIAAEDLPHVFDRFWRVLERAGHGAGLGLAIAKGLVEAHGGRIWVESIPGRGTTFFFTIPTAPRMGAQHGVSALP